MNRKKFYGEVKASAREESGAVKHYRNLAKISRRLGDTKTAKIFTKIAAQESKHQKSLAKLGKGK
jgi:rubrerythrin